MYIEALTAARAQIVAGTRAMSADLMTQLIRHWTADIGPETTLDEADTWDEEWQREWMACAVPGWLPVFEEVLLNPPPGAPLLDGPDPGWLRNLFFLDDQLGRLFADDARPCFAALLPRVRPCIRPTVIALIGAHPLAAAVEALAPLLERDDLTAEDLDSLARALLEIRTDGARHTLRHLLVLLETEPHHFLRVHPLWQVRNGIRRLCGAV